MGTDVRPTVTLRRGDVMPALCLQCGDLTRRKVRVRVVGPHPTGPMRQRTHVPGLLHLIGGLGCLFAFVAGILDAMANRRPRFALSVPQCAECARRGKPVGHSANFTSRRLSFDVHPRFEDGLRTAHREAQRRRDAQRAR